MFLLFSQGALLGLSCAAQPGPFQAYVVARAARAGPAKSLPLVFVPFLSDPILIAVVLFVLSQMPQGLLRGLHLAGGVVVLWLGAGTLREAFRFTTETSLGGRPVGGIWRAALVNLTNPNAWIFWSVVGGPILVSSYRAAPVRALAFMIAFYLLLTGGNVVLVLLAARAAAAGPRLARALGLVSGAALIGFGAWQLGIGVFVR